MIKKRFNEYKKSNEIKDSLRERNQQAQKILAIEEINGIKRFAIEKKSKHSKDSVH